MIKDINEAITHAREEAQKLKKKVEGYSDKPYDFNSAVKKNCLERAAEHEQLASWLTELKERREADRWISVDEALPEKEGWYLVDRKERTSSIQYFFFSTVNHKPYWSGARKVYYWRLLPEAYKESEDK